MRNIPPNSPHVEKVQASNTDSELFTEATTDKTTLSRRKLLQSGALASGGLWLGTFTACSSGESESTSTNPSQGNLQPHGRIELHLDGKVALLIDKIEMGQGVNTGLPTLVGEELNTHPEHIKILQPQFKTPAENPKYSPSWGTGGSSSMAANWGELRFAAATLREWLRLAAAKQKGGAVSDYKVENGQVKTLNGSGVIDWKDLIETAKTLALPEAELKSPPFTYIGQEFPRLHSKERVNGQAVYGIDSGPDDALIAVIERSPYINGILKSADKESAKKLRGVVDIIDMPSGNIAVVAQSYWEASQAKLALKAQWIADADLQVNSQTMLERLTRIPANDGKTARWEGSGWEKRPQQPEDKIIEAEYQVPFLAHATMEPMNCTAWFHDDQCSVWAPTQRPKDGRQYAANAAGLPQEKINFYSTLLGGGFGRRLENDYVIEAVQLAKKAQSHKKAIKVIWSREDDIRNSSYRPMTFNRFKAAINSQGEVSAWQHQILLPGQPEENDRNRGAFSQLKDAILGKDPVINGATEGAADIPYDIPHLDVYYQRANMPTRRGAWRSIGHSQNGFLVESFIDELAIAADQDPLNFRLSLLKKHSHHQAVLKLAAEKANWKPNQRQGIAVHKSYGSTVAHVVELEPTTKGQPIRVKKVTCAIHCGFAVTPTVVKDQMMSNIIFALSAALYGQITYDDQGGVKQSNFHDYPILRMSETPEIEVHIIPSSDQPTGVGEPGLPPLAAALTNAIFAATGERVRQLPLYPLV